jgi:hypothetical protein
MKRVRRIVKQTKEAHTEGRLLRSIRSQKLEVIKTTTNEIRKNNGSVNRTRVAPFSHEYCWEETPKDGL